MNIHKARKITGFEELEPACSGKECERCGKLIDSTNRENYRELDYWSDDCEYACNQCVIALAKDQLKSEAEFVEVVK